MSPYLVYLKTREVIQLYKLDFSTKSWTMYGKVRDCRRKMKARTRTKTTGGWVWETLWVWTVTQKNIHGGEHIIDDLHMFFFE